MDREQEQMQFLGFFGIFKESFKIIISWRKIFSQITVTLILPLTFVFLGHLEILNLLYGNIKHTEYEKHETTRRDSKRYNSLSDTLSSEWMTFYLFKVGYFTIYLILTLLSTAAIVYTIASVYTGRELTFKKVMSVVPKVWKRLMVTFVCMFVAFFIYSFLALFVMVIFLTTLHHPFGVIFFFIALILSVMGFVYMAVIWQLASVVSVLETSYGFGAMTKSMDLIKGNRDISITIFLILNASFILVHILFEVMVVHGSSVETWKRLGYSVLCSLLILALNLYGLVIQTMIYLVCKSYHHENIDKGDLSNHLGSYLGEYKPLSGDVQLEEYHV